MDPDRIGVDVLFRWMGDDPAIARAAASLAGEFETPPFPGGIGRDGRPEPRSYRSIRIAQGLTAGSFAEATRAWLERHRPHLTSADGEKLLQIDHCLPPRAAYASVVIPPLLSRLCAELGIVIVATCYVVIEEGA